MKLLRIEVLHLLAIPLIFLANACATKAVVINTPTQSEKHVRFLHIADTHAQLETHWEYLPEDPKNLHRMGGYARLKTAIDERRSSAPGAVFAVDGGDTFQGSGIAAWTKGEAVVKPLNSFNLDVGTAGNWEVVYGPKVFKKLMSEVNYKVICYNFHDTKTNKRLFDPSVVLEKQGVKVAFVGVTDPTTTERQPPNEVKGIDSTRMKGLGEFVQDLKEKEKPDLIVLVDHTGLAPSVQLAHDIPEFDIILSGHTHERVYKPIMVGHTIVVEPGSMGSFMGQLDVTLHDGQMTDVKYDLVQISEDKFKENEEVKNLIAQETKPFKKRLSKVVGETKTALMRYDVLESTMDNLIADSAREATHSDIAFTNGFRFSPPVAPGPITEADLWNMLPLDAKMKVGEVSGEKLRKYLEHEMHLVFAKNPFELSGGWGTRPSNMTIRFKADAPMGSRITDVKIGSKEIVPSQTYSIGGCERDGEPLDVICRLKGTKKTHYVPGTIHLALESYIKKHSPLNYIREGRVRADDLPDQVWSQYGLLQKMWNIPGSFEGVKVPSNGP